MMIIRLFRPSATTPSLAKIDLDDLQARGIRHIILDLDNTLTEWQRLEVPPDNEAWVREAKTRGMKLCIVSNTRNLRRLKEVASRLDVLYICRALKPRLKGFKEALAMMEAEPSNTAAVGDQLLTDVFGGNRAGLYTILVPPMHPREFIGTKISRLIERLLLFWLRRRGVVGTKPATSQSERKERA